MANNVCATLIMLWLMNYSITLLWTNVAQPAGFFVANFHTGHRAAILRNLDTLEVTSDRWLPGNILQAVMLAAYPSRHSAWDHLHRSPQPWLSCCAWPDPFSHHHHTTSAGRPVEEVSGCFQPFQPWTQVWPRIAHFPCPCEDGCWWLASDLVWNQMLPKLVIVPSWVDSCIPKLVWTWRVLFLALMSVRNLRFLKQDKAVDWLSISVSMCQVWCCNGCCFAGEGNYLCLRGPSAVPQVWDFSSTRLGLPITSVVWPTDRKAACGLRNDFCTSGARVNGLCLQDGG